ncbi:MAG: sugar phosphorylase [Spirochaetia bacterium]
MNTRIQTLSTEIYEEKAPEVIRGIEALTEKWKQELPIQKFSGKLPVSEKSCYMITYGDNFRREGEHPLTTLKHFLSKTADRKIPGVHILPYFPYSSDDGFSIIDYRKVDPALGDWADVRGISEEYDMMTDLVLNHCSKENDWFRKFLAGEKDYQNYFIEVDPDTDLSDVFRPRALPLLTRFESPEGPKHIWSTFSDDQMDLNFAEPKVFLEMLDVFLLYVAQGSNMVRLDAIAYLWKEIGTSCIHHPKTHLMVKLFRAILEEVCSWVILLTETNVPHKENISYFGDNDEAQMVYQFSLPPLVLDAFIRGKANHLQEWAASLPKPDGKTTFFNFCASHDGVGLLPARGILTDQEIDGLIENTKKNGGLVSYKATKDGDVPYEMNISYVNAVSGTTGEPKMRAQKFCTSQAIMLAMPGVPGVYVHSILGSENYTKGVEETGRNRTINREKLDIGELEKELKENPLRKAIFSTMVRMIEVRTGESAFDPSAAFTVLNTPASVFAFSRKNAETGSHVLCLHNVSSAEQKVVLDIEAAEAEEIISSRKEEIRREVSLAPFETKWLRIS